MGGDILVLNAGSSSLKFALFGAGLQPGLRGSVEEIGGDGQLALDGERRPAPVADHKAALALILGELAGRGVTPGRLAAAAHRVVHGGERLTRPARVTPRLCAEIRACIPLAPLHNPHNLAAIEALAELAPELPQFAAFDTGFHADAPEVARRYALPERPETQGLIRYGFHGLSYGALTEALPRLSGLPLPRRLLAFHLGNGASACAILHGRSVATSMGYSPLDGLTMGSRVGEIGADAVLDLARRLGPDGAHALLTNDSGLKGLSGGLSDMRALLASDDPAAAFAVAHFTYWACRHAGSLIAAMQGLDAIAFTGGIGEHAAPVRAAILGGLQWAGMLADRQANDAGGPRLHAPDSPVSAWVVPAEEERRIAGAALALMGGQGGAA